MSCVTRIAVLPSRAQDFPRLRRASAMRVCESSAENGSSAHHVRLGAQRAARLPLRAHREECLQQQRRPQQILGRKSRAARCANKARRTAPTAPQAPRSLALGLPATDALPQIRSSSRRYENSPPRTLARRRAWQITPSFQNDGITIRLAVEIVFQQPAKAGGGRSTAGPFH